MLIDIHTHTFPKSDDSFLTPETLIEEAKRVGLDGICLTDHDGFWDPESVKSLSEKYDFLILPGCEVTTEEGHLLIYGLDKYIFGMHRASTVKELVNEKGGIIVVAHPYRRRFRVEASHDKELYSKMVDDACEDKLFTLADAVEVLNGRGSEKENTFSQEVATRFGMKGTGASDAHKLEDVGTFATEFDTTIRSLEDLIGELREGRYRPFVLKKRQVART